MIYRMEMNKNQMKLDVSAVDLLNIKLISLFLFLKVKQHQFSQCILMGSKCSSWSIKLPGGCSWLYLGIFNAFIYSEKNHQPSRPQHSIRISLATSLFFVVVCRLQCQNPTVTSGQTSTAWFFCGDEVRLLPIFHLNFYLDHEVVSYSSCQE